MQYTPEMAQECASIGAQFLDRYDPNWYEHIDLGDLNMASGCNCIVGQLYAEDHYMGYADAIEQKFEEDRWRALLKDLALKHPALFQQMESDAHAYHDHFLGFDIPFADDLYNDDDDERYEVEAYHRFGWLQIAWINEIVKRRSPAWKTTTVAEPSS